MMIRDLLWACVICGEDAGIRPNGRVEECTACHATYRRGRGASILVQRVGSEAVERNPAEWLAQLAPPADGGEAIAYVKTAHSDKPLWYRGRFMGRIEKFGPIRRGRLILKHDSLTFTPDRGEGFTWALEDLTAVQPSSSELQLKARGHPVVSLKFPESSARIWEERLQRAVRGCYQRLGRGEIVEFQPRICTC